MWFNDIIVRPYAPYNPELIKRVYDSLELDEIRITIDIEHHSKAKTQESKKRKREHNTSNDTLGFPLIKRRRELMNIPAESEAKASKQVSFDIAEKKTQ